MLRRAAPLIVLAGSCLVGCAAYRPGSFAAPGQRFTGRRLTIGCLDVAAELVTDELAQGPVVGYTAGNRCDHAVWLDLAQVRVRGRTGDGGEVDLAPYDPGGELRAALLDARSVAREEIEYQVGGGAGDLAAVCLDLDRLGGEQTAGAGEACLALAHPTPPVKPSEPVLARSEPVLARSEPLLARRDP